jgi:hypothetical protein
MARAQPGTFEESFVTAALPARRREAENLPERKIPRHHSQYNAERLEHDKTVPGFRLDRLQR